MGRKIFSFRLDEALVARIDATDQKRSQFVREALQGALDGKASVDTPAPKTGSKTRPGPFRVLAIGQKVQA